MINNKAVKRANHGDREARNHVLKHVREFVEEDKHCLDFSRRVRDELDDLAQEFVCRLQKRIGDWRDDNFQQSIGKWWRQHVCDVSRGGSLRTTSFDEMEEDESSQKTPWRRINNPRQVEDDLARECDWRKVKNSLELVSEGQREVLILRCQGFNNNEIAEMIGISDSAVASRIDRARNNKKFIKRLRAVSEVYAE